MSNTVTTRIVDRTGNKTTMTAPIPPDYIREVYTDDAGPKAEILFNVSKTYEFNDPKEWLKVEVHVKLACNQTAETLDEAARLAFEKAEEYSRDALSYYLPPK